MVDPVKVTEEVEEDSYTNEIIDSPGGGAPPTRDELSKGEMGMSPSGSDYNYQVKEKRKKKKRRRRLEGNSDLMLKEDDGSEQYIRESQE